MGACQSHAVVSANKANAEIDKQLEMAGRERSFQHKLLLLGTAECGKSTILKQMRILHDSGFSEEELKLSRHSIYDFLIGSMLKIAEAMPKYNIKFEDSSYEILVKGLRKHQTVGCEDDMFSGEVAAILKRLWSDKAIQQMLQWGSQYHLSDSAAYFFDSLDRISSPVYVPTVQDVLRVRVKTTGVVEIVLQLQQASVKVVDVGGQRSERRKWIQCFDDVSSVMFIMALNEYDEMLEEDETTGDENGATSDLSNRVEKKLNWIEKNRMGDSLRLFAYICNHDFFLKAGMILFMNKKDLFETKLQLVPLKTFFKAYTGPNEYQSAVNYIKEQFVSLNRVETKVVYTHETCATDTEQVKYVLDTCFDLIFRKTVNSIGFV